MIYMSNILNIIKESKIKMFFPVSLYAAIPFIKLRASLAFRHHFEFIISYMFEFQKSIHFSEKNFIVLAEIQCFVR